MPVVGSIPTAYKDGGMNYFQFLALLTGHANGNVSLPWHANS